jgi:hypothetical protein
MTQPDVGFEEVVAALSERGRLEWELAFQRVIISKLQADGDIVPDES